jgi:putative transposase
MRVRGRLIATIRRECLDWLIPLSESHLRSVLKASVTYYTGARPHMALGPGVPDRPAGAAVRVDEKSPYHLGARTIVCARSVLAGLHHEYSLAPALTGSSICVSRAF